MKQIRKSRTRLAAAAVAASMIALSACSTGGDASDLPSSVPQEDPKETVTLTLLGYWDAKLIQPVLDAFTTEHPTIEISYEGVGFNELNGVITSRLSSKSGDVDLFSADQPLIASWTGMGFTEDITEPFKDSFDDFSPPVLSTNVIDDKLRAMPLSTSTWYLYYNKDLLDAAGIDYPSADPADRMTWEDIRDDAKKAQDAGAKYGMFFDYADKMVMMLQLAESANGGSGLTGEGNLEPDLTNEGWIDSMEWYRSIFEDGIGPRGVPFAQGNEMFANGEIAYYPSGPWQTITNLGAEFTNFGVAPMPMFEGGKAVSGNGAWSLALSPFSEKKEASLIFMDWMGVQDGGNYIREYPRVNVPATKALLGEFTSKEQFAEVPGLKEQLDLLIPHELNETSVKRPATVGFVEYSTVLEQGFADIRNGADPATVLERVSGALTEAFAKYK